MTAVTSLSFAFFLLVTVSIYWLLPAVGRRYFLLAAGLVFLGLVSLSLLLLVLLLSSFSYWLGRMLYCGSKGKPAFILGLLLPVGVLAYFKYASMLMETFNAAAGLMQWNTLTIPDIAVPVGISFFTFKLLHYLINCYRKETPPGSFRHFLLYMFFFPIFTAGPIERWPHFAAQNPAFSSHHLYTGSARILTGLFKKKVLADNMVIFAGVLQGQETGGWGYWLAAYAYAFQLYFDFSGYSDIAIGSARLFGYEIMENFNWPYLQRNISLFWKNWHMTLTGWFTQYIFIPLGGSRGSFLRTAFNALVVMAVTGIWHGAAWHFMLWGLYHGLGLVIWRIYGHYLGGRLGQRWGDALWLRGLSTIVTFHFVVLGWVFFATDFHQSLYVVSRMLFLK
jgi:alginate O-acetyltransferase complex protein AlgI